MTKGKTHLGPVKRAGLEFGLGCGKSLRATGKELGVSTSTLSREIRKHTYESFKGCYGRGNHELVREVLPKGVSFDGLTQEDASLMMSHVILRHGNAANAGGCRVRSSGSGSGNPNRRLDAADSGGGMAESGRREGRGLYARHNQG